MLNNTADRTQGATNSFFKYVSSKFEVASVSASVPSPCESVYPPPPPPTHTHSGNDDAGQMSAWLFWAAIGLYPAIVGIEPAHYVIASPLVRQARLALPHRTATGQWVDHTLTIVAANNNEDNVYVVSALLDGAALDRAWLSHDELMSHSRLELVMGPLPNRTWGAHRRPPAWQCPDGPPCNAEGKKASSSPTLHKRSKKKRTV
jgi:hypothetical protein